MSSLSSFHATYPRHRVASSAVSSTLCGAGLFVVLAAVSSGCGGPSRDTSAEENGGTTATATGDGTASTAEGTEDGGPEQDGATAAGTTPKRIFAQRFVVAIRERPAETATRIGRMRAGSVLNAKTTAPVGFTDCPAGWYELETGGFVCNRREVIAFDGDRLPEVRFRQPRMADPLPYEFGYIRSEVPVYRRPPTDEEAMEHEGWRPPPLEGEEGAEGNTTAPTDSAPAEPPPATPPPVVAPEAGAPMVAAADWTEVVPEEAPEPITLDSLRGEGVVHHRAMRGFWVSLDRRIRSGPRRYWRTQSSLFVPARAVTTRQGATFEGLALSETTTLPVGFISRRQGTNAESMDERGRLRRARRVYHRDSFAIAREETVGNRLYYVTADGLYYRADLVLKVDRVEREARIPAGVKWIEVNLEHQTLVAYEGDRPVYVTLISSGRVKRRGDEDQDHHTPTGVFRIREKHITNTMDGDGTVVDGPYSIEDVPYVQYFWRSFAFHTAFWHDNFGRTKSHGCVNMSPADSRWLFNWTTPGLPGGWHSVWAPEGEADTTPTYVWVHGETPLG